MKRTSILLLVMLGICSAAAQAAAPQEPDAAQSALRPIQSANAASVPRLVQFSGTLKDTVARPVAGTASVTFAIYAEQDGGAALWSETQNVTADANGHYSVVLGTASSSGVPDELFGTGQSRWLGVQIARQAELPRVLLVSVPYALKAADAELLGGLPASAFVTAQSLAAKPTSLSAANSTLIAAPQATPAISLATPTGGGTTNFIPIWTSSSNLGNSIMFQSGSNIGIGTTSPAQPLDVNGNSIFRGSFQLSPDHPATASGGFNSHSFQFQASAWSSSTNSSHTNAFGFEAVPLNNNTSDPSAKLDLFYGPANGTLADTGLSFSSTGIVTFAPGQTFPGSSVTVNELNLPNTTSSSSGVITLGGTPFINNLGDPTNVFVGQKAGGAFASTTSSLNNTAVGANALFAVATGSDNAAFGSLALQADTSGAGNTAIGVAALIQTGTAGFNTAVGDSALAANTTGSENSGIGYQSGSGNRTGLSDTFLGAFSGANSDGLVNATAVGADSQVAFSNSLILGGTGSFAVNVGIGTAAPLSTLYVNSSKGSSITSPGPILTLVNNSTTSGSSVALDFNPVSTPAFLLPGARIEAIPSAPGAILEFYARNSAGTGEQLTMSLDPFGNLSIPGSLFVTGELQKGSGTFKIDDPIAPAEKYLSHSFVESPDMMNIYNGNVVTDEDGFATVTMPAWFEALNEDFRYQLTAVGKFAQAMVAAEIEDGRFTIRTDKPKVKVSWQVTGIRHDAWAKAHRTPIEEEKPADEQGHYLHPELFGAGPEQAITAAHHSRSLSATPAAEPAANRETAIESAGVTR